MEVPMTCPSGKDIRAGVARYLKDQGIQGVCKITDKELSEALADAIFDNCLTLIPAEEHQMQLNKVRKVDGIIGCAFGHRFQANGNRDPGPINKRLKDVVVSYYKALKIHCPEGDQLLTIVQWEIGYCFSDDERELLDKDLLILEPAVDIERDKVDYVSTKKVMEEVKELLREAQKKLDAQKKEKPDVLVVAHPDQLRRCLAIARSFGFEASAVVHEKCPNEDPAWYDPDSGQLWTRDRYLYLLHDMWSSLNDYRNGKNIEATGKIWRRSSKLCVGG
jgi:hypothetical protein